MKYAYWVNTKELIPTLDENKYFAIAQIHEIGKGPVAHDLGEVWGRTQAEAWRNMNDKIQKWLERNQ
jgi:hypothetical protein